MANRKVDILVYSGSGSTVNSVRQCLYSLRQLLSPNYAVIPVTERTILKEPWTRSCALLVFPGGADTGYCNSLNGDGNRIINQYVRRGGSFLGFCAGGYFGSARCEFEIGNKLLQVAGPRELSFFPGTCRGCAFKGFEYDSEAGAKAVELIIPQGPFESIVTPHKLRTYYNGGGVFVDAAQYSDKGVEILARYSDPLDVDGGNGSAAVVYCKVSEGRAILTGPHPEFATINLDTRIKSPAYLDMIRVLTEENSLRISFLKACLVKLGMKVSQVRVSLPSLSRLHLSSLYNQLVSDLLNTWKKTIIDDHVREEVIKAESNTFCIEKPNSTSKSESLTTDLRFFELSAEEKKEIGAEHMADHVDICGMDQQNSDHVMRHLVLHEANWPESKETPHFNHHVFYSNLRTYQEERGTEAEDFGKYLMYGEIVTSTNTMLEKNPKLLAKIPSGFTFTATTQLSGRGRGSNIWISPLGSLNTSVYLRHPILLSKSAPVVFIQYIVAIAIIQGIHSYEKGFEKIPVRLKWPNDIYVKDLSTQCEEQITSRTLNNNEDQRLYVKIGGILVNSSCSNDGFDLIVGFGLNISNTAPTTSLNSLLSSFCLQLAPNFQFSKEKLLARILTRFETHYKRFCRVGFDSHFHSLYYSYWLHTDQIVTLESESGVRARIKGITSDWGLLRVEVLSSDHDRDDNHRSTGEEWTLQPDCNSFDFFKGLFKAKK